jgi:hypothetical protein
MQKNTNEITQDNLGNKHMDYLHFENNNPKTYAVRHLLSQQKNMMQKDNIDL